MPTITGHRLSRRCRQTLIRVGLAWAFACAVSPAWAQTNAPAAAATTAARLAIPDGQDGVFQAVSREVTVVHGSSRSAALVGNPIQAGDRILTGPQSAAALALRDGTRLSIGPSTRLELTQFLYESKTGSGNLLLTLVRGTVRVVTGSIARVHPDQFKLVTPTAVIASRSADFIVEQAP